ncbi:MAG TPA: alpha/beta hydrolase [Allosphingosinicella sp.]|jgi:pimeloyl-ACP methyl ester carboxylesterase
MARWTADDGIAIAYEMAGEADRPAVILQHGFGSNRRRNWVRFGFVDALLAAGKRVVTVDARGHGESDKPHDSAFYGESRMARDLAGIADTLGLESFDLVGYSMGAVVSLLLAVADSRVRRLVIGGVGEGVVAKGGVDTRAVAGGAIAAALLAEDPATIPPPAAAFRAFVDANGGDRLALAAQARAAHQQPIPLERVAMPTLLIAGDRDPLAIRPENLAAALPVGRLLLLEGDHLGVFADPRFVPAVVDFLSAG